jgi:hypothetical protein
MKLPQQKKILREDLKGAPEYVNGIIDPVNSFMESTYQALNKNLTLNENLSSFTKELTYKTVSTYPTNQPVTTFKNSLKIRPTGVWVMQAYDKTTYTPAPGPVYVPWIVDNNGDIAVHTITGLEANKTYLIRLVVF